MAGSKTDPYEVDVLKATTGQATTILTTTPITPYISLATTAHTDSAAGTEVSGGSYARISSATKWAVPAAGSVSTNAALSYTAATANWGTVVSFAVNDAVSAGNRLMWGDLTTSKAINTGDTAQFASGALTLTED